ncbi:MAG: DUF1387 domain-containing protein [Anaerolineae bacterium]|nr:DUF1387 domain-containing protein [Anaerolineae bacterium]
MPAPHEIEAEKQRLYESAALREDINDAEATILLQWGEAEVVKLADRAGDQFEQQCRFLRQLLKNINRFVGQREYNDEAGQTEYLEKVTMWLPKLGYPALTARDILGQLPGDAKDMTATLRAVLLLLTPPPAAGSAVQWTADEF